MADETITDDVTNDITEKIIDLSDCYVRKDLANLVWSSIIDKIYPKGSIYMTVMDIDPNEKFGGEWVKIENRFLLASGSEYNIHYDEYGCTDKVGGSADAEVIRHYHTQPSHRHTQVGHTHTQQAHSHATSKSSHPNFLIAEDELDIRVNGAARKKPTRTDANEDWFFVHAEGNGGLHGCIWEVPSTSSVKPTIDTKVPGDMSKEGPDTNEYGVLGQGRNMPPYLVVNIWKRIE